MECWLKRQKGIRVKLVGSFMLIILITVIALELLLTNIVRQNYYKNLEDTLYEQIKVSTKLYSKYFADSSLYDSVLNNVDTFWRQSTAQVQILDVDGLVLMDSIGTLPIGVQETRDVKEALEGRKGTWIGNVSYDTEKVMAVSYPLTSRNQIVGVLRFITSLREVNKDIGRISTLFIYIGGLVIFLSGCISIIIANTIVYPLREVTGVAAGMAAGNLSLRSAKRHEDEVGQLSDTLNYMAQEILKRDQLKNDFISSVSHELRTPLTSIKGWAVTLKSGNLNDLGMVVDGLDIIEKESDRLTEMVEELLDFSRFISGKVMLRPEKVDIAKVMEHLQKQLMPRASHENINFFVEKAENLPIMWSDENRLKQIFINVLDNAFKFTPAGGTVHFSAARQGDFALFRVCDTGCGIPPEELPMIKEKFYKGKSSKSRNGIGLSVCDEIIQLMGGTLNIQSQINRGTEVNILLPVKEV